jgi:hypothetical protein
MPGASVEPREASSRLETIFRGARREVNASDRGGRSDVSLRCS